LLLSDYLSTKSLLFIEKYQFLFHKFESAALQLSAENSELTYASLQAKYNQSTQDFPSLLWEFEPDHPITGAPFYFKNHITGLYEVVVQDKKNTIYLVSTNGQLIWKKQLDGKVLGSISQVDGFKNGKFQLLLSTQNTMYLIDRNGKDVEDFPVVIKQKIADQGIQVMDYDANRTYRILIPTKDNDLLNYSIEGIPVEGWSFKGKNHQIVSNVNHFAVQGKDYVVCTDEKGNVYVLDRRGNSRLSIKQKIISSQDHFKITKGSSIEKSLITYTDNVGVIHNVYFDGKQSVMNAGKEYFSEHFFSLADINKNGDNEYVYANTSSVDVYNPSLEKIYGFKADSIISNAPEVYSFNNEAYLGFTSKKANKIYLLDSKGKLYNRFPLDGNTSFSIRDINADGELDLAVGTKQGALRVYSLSK